MEGQNHIGIYLGRTTATAVCMTGGRNGRILECFSVFADTQQEEPVEHIRQLADLVAKECSERNLTYSETSVALDCSMFMQHKIHSSFSDAKQIASTIKFDTEEVLTTNISEVAMAYLVDTSGDSGSELTVFTAEKKQIAEIIESFQANNMDPVYIEPDIYCLLRTIIKKLPENIQDTSICCLFSEMNGYFVIPRRGRKNPVLRTFLAGSAQDRTSLLIRQIPVTTAQLTEKIDLKRLSVLDYADRLDTKRLAENSGLETKTLDINELTGSDEQMRADCANNIDLVIACGAATAHTEKNHSINFRNDFMPYMGKKMILQNTVKFLGICIFLLAMAAGIYYQSLVMEQNRKRKTLRKTIGHQYSQIMMGRKLSSRTNPVQKLKGELIRIKDMRKGKMSITGEQSITAKLTMILDAFNSCASQTDLKIDSISITPNAIKINADTSSRSNSLKLFDKMKKSGLNITRQQLEQKDNRDKLSVTVSVKNQ